jgi:hypothetical protein
MNSAALRTGIPSLTLAVALLHPFSTATAQTRQFLDAPVVRSLLRVTWNSDPNVKAMQWAADKDDTFRAFQTDAVFLTKTSIYISYPRLNRSAFRRP